MLTSNEACDLFRVLRTDTETWERRYLTYPASDFATASRRADYYQSTFGHGGRYDYRVSFVD